MKKTFLLLALLLTSLVFLPFIQNVEASSDPWFNNDWNNRVKITLNSSDVDSQLTNFPILINISDSSGQLGDDISFIFDEVESDYNACAYTTVDTTRLYFEVESWDNVTEEAYVWVKVPSISNTSDTILYLYFDVDQDGSSYNNPVNVWDDNFVMVQHLQEGGDVIFVPSIISTDIGTLDSGNLTSVQTVDGNTYNVSEVIGTPGFVITTNFTYVVEIDNLNVNIYAHYSGNIGHTVDVDVYNFTSSLWYTIGQITDGVALAWFNNSVGLFANFVSSGLVQIKINHTSAGNVNHDLFIDYIGINGTSTSTLFDSTSNNNDGTLQPYADPPNSTSGKLNGALSFDGTNDRVDCGNDVSLNLTSSITIDLWVKISGHGGSVYQMLVSRNYKSYELYLYQSGESYRVYGIFVLPNTTRFNTFTDYIIALNIWYHIVWEYPTKKIYVNGSDVTAFNNNQTQVWQETNVFLGARTGNSLFLNGTLDEIRISNISRSASWIKTSYETQIDDLLDFGSIETVAFLTIYFDFGIQYFFVNGMAYNNGTTIGLSTGIIANITSAMDSRFTFFKYVYDAIGTLENPIYENITGNHIVWAYSIQTDVFPYQAMAVAIISLGLIIAFLGRRKLK